MQKNNSALAKYIRQRIDDEYVALKHAKHRYEDSVIASHEARIAAYQDIALRIETLTHTAVLGKQK